MALRDGGDRERATSLTNPTYKLDATDRLVLGIMSGMGRWPKERLAKEFGVSRKTVIVCERRYLESTGQTALPQRKKIVRRVGWMEPRS